jgi:hypothetical protein
MLSLLDRKSLAAALLSAVALLTPAGAGASQDGPPMTFEVTVEAIGLFGALTLPDGSRLPAPISPGLYLVSSQEGALFRPGKTAGDGLESLAERGDAKPWLVELAANATGAAAYPFMHDQSFEIAARPGDRLFLAAMFVQSNDLFYAPGPEGIALFDAKGQPFSGEVALQLKLWDAGTEVNEQPGLGANQAPRQATPESGVAENGTVHLVDDGFAYPATADVVRVTIVAR